MLVERDAELAALGAAVTRAAGGTGSATLVSGVPGIGKSALLAGVRAAAAPGVRVLAARGGELETDFPFGVLRQLFEGVLAEADEAGRARLLAGPARPAGALLDGGPAAATGDAASLEHAFYRLAAALAEQRPLLLLADDLHWADPSSLRALVYLARRVTAHPVALVMAARPGTGARGGLLDRLAAEATVLEPAPISAAGVRRYVGRLLAGADDAFGTACHAASGGNPFLVTELVGAVRASGIEPVAANAGRVRAVSARRVRRSVLLRLGGLSPDATPVAHALAVLGECARPGVIARVAGRPVAAAGAALDELRAAHLVADDEPARFVHAIVHSAVHDDVPPARRSLLHTTAARVLAEAGAPADAVAGHLLLTVPGSDPWVRAQLTAAAASGPAASTPETAAAYLDRALQESVAGPAERRPLLLALGGARFQTLAGGAVEPFREALAGAREPRDRAEIGLALASAYMTERRYAECWALIDDLLAGAAGHPDVVTDIELFAAQSLYTHLDGATAQVPTVERWRPDPAGRTTRDRSMLATRAWVSMCRAAPAAATAAAARAALSTGTLIADDTFYVTFEMAVWGLVGAGCWDEALAALDAAVESRRSAGRLLRAATLMVLRAEVRRRVGLLDLAEEDARLAVEIIPPEQVYAPQAASALVFVLLTRGALAEARAVLAARGYDAAVPDGGVGDVLWLARGQLRLAGGDAAGGLADVLRYGEISESLGRRNPGYFPWRTVAAAALLAPDRPGDTARSDRADRLVREQCDLADRAGVAGVRGAARAALGATRRGDDAVVTLESALDLLERSPLVLDTVAAQVDLGRALRSTGRRARAGEVLRRALDTATRVGAPPLAERARAELLACGARPRRAAIRGVDALTPSEHRVAALAAQGLTNRELAHALFVTPKTIEAHLAAAYRKLGIAGKADLARALTPAP